MRPGLRAAVGLLRVVAGLLVVSAAAQAQTQTVQTFVSNTGQDASTAFVVVGDLFGSRYSRATGFTTGGNPNGYTLSSVEIFFLEQFGGGDEARVSIYEGDGSGNPGASLYILSNPSSIRNGRLNTFTAPANATLEKDTEYFIVVEAPTGSFRVGLTVSDAEDMGKANGWSIADDGYFKTSSSTTWSSHNNTMLRIAINGTLGATATGQPGIRGTPQVGQTLTADRGTIDDDDGLPETFPDDYSFQWVRVDADGTSNPTDIPAATGSTYTLGTADVGKTIKVQVSFTDDAGNAETLASDATVAVTVTPATVTGVAFTNPPSDGVYDLGDTIEVSVTFSEAVAVTDAPRVRMQLVLSDPYAAYVASASTATVLVFRYTVTGATDDEPDGILCSQTGWS